MKILNFLKTVSQGFSQIVNPARPNLSGAGYEKAGQANLSGFCKNLEPYCLPRSLEATARIEFICRRLGSTLRKQQSQG